MSRTSVPGLAVVSVGLWLSLVLVSGCVGPVSPNPIRGLLKASPYSSLIVEVDYAEGKAPRSGAMALLEQRISERLNKPGGVTVEQASFAASKSTYSADDLRRLEDEQRTFRDQGTTAAFYVLYVNGHFDQDTDTGRVLGVHYDRTSIAIFKDSVDGAGPLGLGFGAEDVERSVLVHEFGHALGLVDNGAPMVSDHEDKDHPKHSNNQDSVMYWAVENTLGLPLLGGGPPNQFDSSDIADLRAVGGK